MEASVLSQSSKCMGQLLTGVSHSVRSSLRNRWTTLTQSTCVYGKGRHSFYVKGQIEIFSALWAK